MEKISKVLSASVAPPSRSPSASPALQFAASPALPLSVGLERVDAWFQRRHLPMEWSRGRRCPLDQRLLTAGCEESDPNTTICLSTEHGVLFHLQ